MTFLLASDSFLSSFTSFTHSFEMDEHPNQTTAMGRPDRSPSPVSTRCASTASVSHESVNMQALQVTSQSTEVLADDRRGSQKLHMSSSNECDDGCGEYKPVAADDGLTCTAQYRKRKVELATILADCIAILIPLGLVFFVILIWSLKGSRVIADSHASWQNAITVVNYFE